MKGFNRMINQVIPNCLQATASDDVPDTDSNVGEFGDIESPKEEQEKVVLRLDGGVEIHIPMSVARQVVSALSDDGGCDAESV